MTTPPPWMLRRFAVRALCVLARHEHEFAAHESTLLTLPSSAEAYIIAYAHTAETRDELVDTTRRNRRELTDLARMIANYAAMLQRCLPGFVAKDVLDHYFTADDALAAGQRTLAALARGRAHAVSPSAPYWPELEETLADAMRTLDATDSECVAATSQYRNAQTRLGVLGDALHLEVEALRTRLRGIVGIRHDDYRKLGIDGAWIDDEDDDLIAADTVIDDIDALEFDDTRRRAS